jgi:hypothetical protein
MRGAGRFDGNKMEFGGTEWQVTSPGGPGCLAPPEQPHGYNLDVFTGWVSEDGTYFDSTNTDGGRMNRWPTPFRRVACTE